MAGRTGDPGLRCGNRNVRGEICRRKKQGRISEKKNQVRLISVIQDTGIGMTPAYMKEMYHKFTRAVDTRVNQVRGSGLGLSIVKQSNHFVRECNFWWQKIMI